MATCKMWSKRIRLHDFTEQWYKVTIPPAERNIRGKKLQNDFDTLFAINGIPKGAALYRHPNEATDTHFLFLAGGSRYCSGFDSALFR